MSINVRTLNGVWGRAERPAVRRASGSERGSGLPADWRAARRHSWIVRALRVALPAFAFVVVASMFITVQTRPKGIGDIDLGEVGLDGTTLTMQNPSLSGFNENGTSYQVTAVRALQDVTNPRVVTLEQINGTMSNADGTNVRVTAKDGVFDADAQIMDLSNKIVVKTDNGESAFLESAHIDMEAGSIVSADPVRAETKNGRIRANSMEIRERGAHLLFTGKVQVELRMDGGPLDGGPAEGGSVLGGARNRTQNDGSPASPAQGDDPARESGSDEN